MVRILLPEPLRLSIVSFVRLLLYAAFDGLDAQVFRIFQFSFCVWFSLPACWHCQWQLATCKHSIELLSVCNKLDVNIFMQQHWSNLGLQPAAFYTPCERLSCLLSTTTLLEIIIPIQMRRQSHLCNVLTRACTCFACCPAMNQVACKSWCACCTAYLCIYMHACICAYWYGLVQVHECGL